MFMRTVGAIAIVLLFTILVALTMIGEELTTIRELLAR